MPLRGGGVGPLMANAIKNFHFDYVTTSLILALQDKNYEKVSIINQIITHLYLLCISIVF